VKLPRQGKARTNALQELALAQELHHPCIVATQVRRSSPSNGGRRISRRRAQPHTTRPSRARPRRNVTVLERAPAQECGVDHDTHTAHIVQEHCTGGTLKAWLADAAATAQPPAAEATVLSWLAQLALALEYLHTTHRTIHRDVKSTNVFLQDRPPTSSGALLPPFVKLGVPMQALPSRRPPLYRYPPDC
jgi:serine/threonine protein kinase